MTVATTPLAASPAPHEITHNRKYQPQPPPPPPQTTLLTAVQTAAAAAPPAPQRKPLAAQKPRTKATEAAPTPPLQRQPLTPISHPSMSSSASPTPVPEGPRMSMTSKEWVIPPRPKPGRKPATDTPPTKRKAQNRAAQRAFRERRAARVGELEEQLDHQLQQHDQEKLEMKDKIHTLELDLQTFRSRCVLLENMLDKERQERIRAETDAETWKRRFEEETSRNASMSRSRQPSYDRYQHSGLQHRGSVSHRNGPQSSISISQIITPPDLPDDPVEAPLTCGNCSPEGPCACAEEVLASVTAGCGKCSIGSQCQCLEDVSSNFNANSDLKRPASPSAPTSNDKRHRPSLDTSGSSYETNMTNVFSNVTVASMQEHSLYQTPIAQPQPEVTMPIKDRCGFCKDGTYCMCAEAALATPALTPSDTLPPITRQIHTPPPSETDVVPPPMPMEMTADGAVKLRPRNKTRPQPAQAPSRGCGPNGPGTCAQCQADPKSGLFCRLMAANFDRQQGGSGGGCCGGKGANGGCCKAGPKKQNITLPSLPSLGLSCAEAYQTLSSHRNFDQAADDINSWLPKLKATPRPGGSARAPAPGRMPIEVEAASIMSVLKDFDVRFGREC
ncbi:bZIP transcription factor hapX [Paramyrothecium foliicola]|nr:bZIP transcription factor hapX [Paramyrothecium foliicola]